MGEQYFHDTPTSASRRRSVPVRTRGVDVVIESDRGLFSPHHVDVGTAALLAAAPAPPETGTFLDLGCGYGPIAVVLATLRPAATVWAVDVNERARELCRHNAERLGLTNVEVAAPDEVPADVRFDLVWSNPPIRVGKVALHEILLRWLDRRTPTGETVLVVHKHLGADSLARWLTDHLGPTTRLASKKGFRVLRVAPPAAGGGPDSSR